MSNQTPNTTNRKGETRYVLSPAQQSFLHKLKDWIITNPNSASSDPSTIIKYMGVVINALKNDGYDEDDRFTINHIRNLYLIDKNKLPF